MAEGTPMKNQYNEIKAQYTDCLLAFRLGDFYEFFDDDAKICSRELELTLTTRDRGVENPDERTPMCGVPYHAFEGYMAKLVAKGYKVAICEQLEDPALAKGIVKRDVIRIISPGTAMESSMLEAGKNNYICALTLSADGSRGGAAFCDISTGELCCAEFVSDARSHIVNELGRFAPAEAIVCPEAAKDAAINDFLTQKLSALINEDSAGFSLPAAEKAVCNQYGAESSAETGLVNMPEAVKAAGALLSYLKATQKCDLSYINKPEVFYGDRFMELDWTTRRNLELTGTLRSGEKRGTLLWVLDKTKTPMGSRMLRSWVDRPLLSVTAIRRRLSAVDELYRANIRRGEIIEVLKGITDLQRLVNRAVYGTAGGRDLRALANCAAVLPKLSELTQEFSCAELQDVRNMDTLQDIYELVDRAIVDEPPFSVREGGLIREGFDDELDRLRDIRDNGARMVAEIEQRERERTGIKKLKVGYNKVFGYFIDVPKSAGDTNIPDDYIRKQTLVSNERYFTPELKNLENTLLNARDRINDMEYRFFSDIREEIASQAERVQNTAEAVARLDVLCSLAEVAVRNNYCCPEVDLSKDIVIREGRHPVVEQTMRDVMFVPNDTFLNDKDDRAAIVTGPNMAGKSTYMRQTALIVLMAQMGSFVPAKSATIGIVDRVFTRIGASDDLASGMSTFMVEMSETAAILKAATSSSLIILDEIGRGTSTYDGMAIARAVLEYCADRKKLGAKTMFATHYHELSELEGLMPGVRNYNISAKKQGDRLVFLRKIVRGAADDSYGIEVAKLAGIPDTVINKAKQHLKNITESLGKPAPAAKNRDDADGQISFEDVGTDEVKETLINTDLNTLTPLEAMNLLYSLQQKVRG